TSKTKHLYLPQGRLSILRSQFVTSRLNDQLMAKTELDNDEIVIATESVMNQIFNIRGQKVMLDFHLAALYEVENRILKQAVKRKQNRFPDDFMFQLTK